MTDPAAPAPVERLDLLPSNASPRELAIQDADAAIADVEVGQIVTARDPATTPIALLPRLAWERSVDVWDPAWPEDIKRAVVVAAPEVHRHKGTVYAVKTALSALKVDATITEWWQQTPRAEPYSFTVTAYARARLYDGPILDQRLINAVFSSILRTKPASRAFDFIIGAAFPATLGLASVLIGKVALRQGVQPRPVTETHDALGLAAVAVGKAAIRIGAEPRPVTAITAQVAAAPVCTAKTRLASAVIPVLPA